MPRRAHVATRSAYDRTLNDALLRAANRQRQAGQTEAALRLPPPSQEPVIRACRQLRDSAAGRRPMVVAYRRAVHSTTTRRRCCFLARAHQRSHRKAVFFAGGLWRRPGHAAATGERDRRLPVLESASARSRADSARSGTRVQTVTSGRPPLQWWAPSVRTTSGGLHHGADRPERHVVRERGRGASSASPPTRASTTPALMDAGGAACRRPCTPRRSASLTAGRSLLRSLCGRRRRDSSRASSAAGVAAASACRLSCRRPRSPAATCQSFLNISAKRNSAGGGLGRNNPQAATRLS
jgi:hypothetical protein